MPSEFFGVKTTKARICTLMECRGFSTNQAIQQQSNYKHFVLLTVANRSEWTQSMTDIVLSTHLFPAYDYSYAEAAFLNFT